MTQLNYLTDSYNIRSTGRVTEVKKLEDQRTSIILDQTIFYPQGGGQPSDHGIISSSRGDFIVDDVRLDKDGTVYHIGSFKNGSFNPGETVELLVDKDRRLLNMRIHSAGHLIDCAVNRLQLSLQPTKGYHFPEGPYVEYEGAVPNSEEMIKAIQEQINKLVIEDIPVTTQQLSWDEALGRGISVPMGKSARLVSFEGFEPCGCGGTHVNRSSEIGNIIIRKIKTKAGSTRISYEVK